MQRNRSSITTPIFLIALFVMMLLPAMTFAQRLVVVRSRRPHVLVYRARPYVIYQQPYYTSSYSTRPYYSYSYTPPYYTPNYYSYGYSQRYYVNPYAYSVYPAYSYGYGEYYRPRYRSSRLRVGIWFR